MILPHRDPGVGDDDIRPFHRLACIADAARATLPQREIGLGRLIPLRARRNDIELHQPGGFHDRGEHVVARSEEHTSELQSLMRISYAVFCLKKNTFLTELLTPRTLTSFTLPI